MKKIINNIFKTIFLIASITVLVMIFLKLKNEYNRYLYDDKNYYIENYKNQDYYVLKKIYDGEQEYKYLQSEKMFNHLNTIYEIEDDVANEYETFNLYKYDEYVDYCNKYNLEKPYNDENKLYIIATDATRGYYGDINLVDIETNENTVKLYLTEYILGPTTGGFDTYTLIVPVDKNIEKIEYIHVCTEEEFNHKKEISSIGYMQTEDKPVIYFYPEKETKIKVSLDLNGELTCTYPEYKNGWEITAKPDGTLIDKYGKEYNYLYWEGTTKEKFDFSEGFCIKGKDTAEFLENALSDLGLNRKEANEFIVYWLPRMQNNKYNIISFQTDKYTENAKLNISPAPDNLIRVFMAYYPADEKINIKEQILKTPARDGFTVVEWGGTEVFQY